MLFTCLCWWAHASQEESLNLSVLQNHLEDLWTDFWLSSSEAGPAGLRFLGHHYCLSRCPHLGNHFFAMLVLWILNGKWNNCFLCPFLPGLSKFPLESWFLAKFSQSFSISVSISVSIISLSVCICWGLEFQNIRLFMYKNSGSNNILISQVTHLSRWNYSNFSLFSEVLQNEDSWKVFCQRGEWSILGARQSMSVFWREDSLERKMLVKNKNMKERDRGRGSWRQNNT